MSVQLTVVVPMYNEQEVAHLTYRRLTAVLKSMGVTYEIIFVNDGSSDSTGVVLNEFVLKDERVKVVEFTRNFGHEAAMSAGLEVSQGDAIALIDGDLQDPPELIPRLYDRYLQGYDIVYAQREERIGESALKLATAKWFYRLLHRLSTVDIPKDTGNFRIISRRVADALEIMPERSRVLRGLVAWTGYSSVAVPFQRDKRAAGRTKYSMRRMIDLAVTSLISFSASPLRLAIIVGFMFLLLGFAVFGIILLRSLVYPALELGVATWTNMLLLFLGGLQIMVLGVIGEYLHNISHELRQRPLYLVDRIVEHREVRDSVKESNLG